MLSFDEGTDRDRLRRAFTLGADAVAFDLEDQVPRAELPTARDNISAVIDEFGSETPVFVRVNKVDNHEILADLEAIVRPGLHSVLVPKVEHPNDVIILDRLLAYFERRQGLDQGSIHITPLLETAQGVRQAYEVAAATPRTAYMGGLVSKNGDPALSIGFRWTPGMAETTYIRQKCIIDARAAGVRYPLGGLWNPLDDEQGLRNFAEQTHRIGYYGMIVLPIAEHIAVVNEIFTPTQADIDFWSGIVPLVEEAQTHVFVNGEMFPPNKVKWGRREIDLAAAFGVGPSEGLPKLEAQHVGAMADSMRSILDT
ncbi:HpcH/HpaI aldolase/citrate lyase family protein [Mycobacterium sp. NPDC003449]